MLNIPIILGTVREGRYSEKAARFMLKQLQNLGLQSEIIDTRDFIDKKLTSLDYAQKIAQADALIVVAPEYNHSFPGEFKTMFDSLKREYAYKPLGICGVSAGFLGGARMVEQLKLVAIELRMVPIKEALYFSNITELFDGQNNLKNDAYEKQITAFLEELKFLAEALKPVRKKIIQAY